MTIAKVPFVTVMMMLQKMMMLMVMAAVMIARRMPRIQLPLPPRRRLLLSVHATAIATAMAAVHG